MEGGREEGTRGQEEGEREGDRKVGAGQSKGTDKEHIL